MAEVIKMPKLSDTMTEGVIAEWHKNVGDKVHSGDVLAEIETDKATLEFEAFDEGVLLYKGLEKGEGAPVDSVLAIIGEEGEDISELLENLKKEESAQKEEAKPEQVTKTESKPVSQPKKIETQPVAKTVVQQTATTYPPASSVAQDGRLKISPLAKKLAEERGINVSFIKGTGEGGRIVKRDIDNYTGGGNTFVGVESYRDEPVSQMRKVIAARLAESKFTAPHFYLTISIDMDNAIEARKSINATIAPQKISFNDLVIKASAAALREHPEVNAGWYGDFIRYNEHIHIGVAVAVPDGLLVPVVRFADGKPLRKSVQK